jgi:hypothetical protein
MPEGQDDVGCGLKPLSESRGMMSSPSKGDRRALIAGLISFLIEAGLQMSGITNLPLAISLWGLAGALFFWYFLGSRIKKTLPFVRANLIPLMLGAMGLAGVILIGAAIVGTLAYYGRPTNASASSPMTTITQSIDSPRKPDSTAIQWNQILGTSRAVDLVFALFLDGTGAASKSIKLKDAFLESAITGETIQMKFSASTNPLDETFPISEANPIPREAFIRLVAQMNPADANKGIPNKEFLDRWGKIWFNAIYEEGRPDRILFDMSGYFPGLVGPRVTRRSDTKDH